MVVATVGATVRGESGEDEVSIGRQLKPSGWITSVMLHRPVRHVGVQANCICSCGSATPVAQPGLLQPRSLLAGTSCPNSDTYNILREPAGSKLSRCSVCCYLKPSRCSMSCDFKLNQHTSSRHAALRCCRW